MASKTQHVQDNSVLERRLRPIYDSLDYGNNKKALQEADKVLRKTPNLQCAKGLKALALFRLGKEADSEALLDSVVQEKPFDEATLQVMSICYREMNQLEKICTVYDNAVKQTSNEELMSHLFMSYVRISDFKSQQTTALALYKLKPKNPYYFWAVMSVVLQANRGTEEVSEAKKSLLLALAERMVNKIITENKMEAEQECQLYLLILELQRKHKEALAFLDSPVGTNLLTSCTASCRLRLLKELQMWPELNTLCKTLLWANIDRWDYYKDYLTSAFYLFPPDVLISNDYPVTPEHDRRKSFITPEHERRDSLTTPEQDKRESPITPEHERRNSPDTCPEQCFEFLCLLIELGEGIKQRGPFLARIELYRRMQERGYDAQVLMGDYIELLVEYFRLFGDRGCCVGDLKLPLESLPKTINNSGVTKIGDRLTLATRLIQEVGISSTVLPQTKQQMQRHISSLQLSRFCGAHLILSAEHLEALFTALTLHYEHGWATYGNNLLSTDLGPSDAYALIAAHVMFDLAKKLNVSKPLVEALSLLRYVLKNSPSNFHVKLLCLQIYHLLGCGLGASEMYESLDVKHLQLDSLGHLHCAPLYTTGAPTAVHKLQESTLNFFTTNYKDTIEQLTLSYKYGSFSKLFEFMDFRERLSCSLHYTTVAVDRLIADLVRHPPGRQDTANLLGSMLLDPKADKIQWDKVCDNRDLEVITHWDPPSHINVAKITFEQNLDVLKIRSYLIRIIGAISDIATDTANKQSHVEVLDKLVDEWENVFDEISNRKHEELELHGLADPMPSRVHSLIQLPYRKVFTGLARFVKELSTGSTDAVLSSDGLLQVQRVVQSTCKAQSESTDPLWTHRKAKETIVHCMEILTLSVVLVGLFNEISKGKMKKSKKKNEAVQAGSINLSLSFAVTLKESLDIMDNALDEWKTPAVIGDLSKSFESLTIIKKDETATSLFDEDFNLFVRQYKSIVKDNIKYILKSNT